MSEYHVKDKISEYIDGMLSQEDSSAVKEHLEHCPECLEEYEEMMKIVAHMNQMESFDIPDSFVERVHDRMEKSSMARRLVSWLFHPLKIKVPLELAGVAAAALLVIYIIGVRGKQHVYELAYAQRSQPLVLQEQRTDEAMGVDKALSAKVDESDSPSEKSQPVLEPEEEKADRRDKRIAVEKEPSAEEKELPVLAPQAKRTERRAKVEEAVPAGKMVKKEAEADLEHQEEMVGRKVQVAAKVPSAVTVEKREEPSLEIAKKEKGEVEEDALTMPIPKEEILKDIVIALGGEIIESEYNEETQLLKSFKIEIPTEKYQQLIQVLEERGDIQKPYPEIKEKDQERITIRLILQR